MKNADMPAMPSGVQLDNKDPQSMYHPNGVMQCHGLTKREMMAMHIAAGFAADGQITTDNVVKWSVEVADKLLQELDHASK